MRGKGSTTLTFAKDWKCGFRGGSSFEILDEDKVEILVPFSEWESPQGAIGVSRYALASTKANTLKVRLKRGGRTYGAPKKKTVLYYFDEQGRQQEKEIVDDEELAELLD